VREWEKGGRDERRGGGGKKSGRVKRMWVWWGVGGVGRAGRW